MTDPIATAIVGAAGKALDPTADEAAKAGGELFRNLFGPVTSEVGLAIAARFKESNVRKVAERASKKRPDTVGAIPVRLGAAVFDVAAFAEDEFVADYLSGVLASSKSEGGKNDGGIPWTALIARLSSDQIRVHFLLCSTARVLLEGQVVNRIDKYDEIGIYCPLLDIWHALPDDPLTAARWNESLMGLQREGLLGTRYAVNAKGEGLETGKQVDAGPGLVYSLSAPGIALFLWGIGQGDVQVSNFLASPISPPEDLGLPIPLARAVLIDDVPAGAPVPNFGD